MSQRSKPKPTGQKGKTAAKAEQRRWRGIVAAVLIVVLGVGVWFVVQRVGPKPPVVSTASLDPAVARLLDQLTREVRGSPRAGTAWGKLGAAFFAYGFDKEAATAFTLAQKFSPDEPRWPYRHALVQIEMGAPPEQVITNLESAVRLSRDQADMPRLRLAQFLLERGRSEQAEPHFQQLLRLQAGHAPALLGLARIRLAQGRVAESLELVNRCADDPHVARSAQALLAQLQQRLGNAAAAETAGRRSASLPPDRPWPDAYLSEFPELRVGRRALMDVAQELIEAQRHDEALTVLASVTNNYPRDPEAYYGIGLVLNHAQRSVEAERVLREHVRLATNSAHGCEQLAAALQAQKRDAEAVAVLERAIQIMPTFAKAHHRLGVACARLDRPDEAIGHLHAALKHDPKNVESYGVLADLLSVRGRHAEAAEALEHAVQLRPGWAKAHFNLGYVCVQLGRNEDAIRHLRDARQHDPADIDSCVLLAQLLARRGGTNEAAGLLRQALLLDPAEERAKALLKEMGQGK
ncbi:MAG: tetratricopeptide repeat protein [Verrucomicrobia bacterium]|nr:tetratricopeptide repeat protein [Verrucomicrobiota bacterium]